MAVITAKGKFANRLIVCKVTDNGGQLVLDCGEDTNDLILDYFQMQRQNAPAMGGTFYPQKDSMLAAYSVFQSSFFDELPELLEVDGDIGTVPVADDIPDAVF